MDQILQGIQAATIQLTMPNCLQMIAADLERGNPVQFIIWISSVKQPSIALEDGVKTVYEQIASPTSSLETAVLKFQWQVPYYRMYGAQIADCGRWEEEQTARENSWVTIPQLWLLIARSLIAACR